MVSSFTSYRIEERSYVALLKREIHQSNLKRRFSKTQIGEIDIIVSEITSNLIKYVGHGDVLHRAYDIGAEDSAFEIICLDKGAGITDTLKMRRDGYSTSATLGQGLGAIERLSSRTQLYSIPGWGTILYALVTTNGIEDLIKSKHYEISTRALLINKTHETVCGDGYFVQNTASHYRILFGDGLGHGHSAKEAMDRAGEYFIKSKENDPVVLLREIHEAVRRTRGLVATVAICEKQHAEWNLAGVGNILTRFYSGVQHKNYMPYNGTIGLNIPTSMNSSTVPLEKNQHVIMCSDGINTRWDLNKYPAIFRYDGIILASCIYHDNARGTDDASVLVTKVN